MRASPFVISLLFQIACSEDGLKDASSLTDSGSSESGTEGLAPMEVTAEVSTEVHTVVTVRWTTTEATSGYVAFGEDDGYEMRTPLTAAGTSHEVLLLGLPADTTAHFQVVTVAEDGTEVATDDHTITTGSLPPELPALTVTGEVKAWKGGYQVFPIQGTTYAVTIVDDQGRYVWYDVLDSSKNVMRALISHDRTAMIYCLAGVAAEGESATSVVMRVSLDGYTVEEIPLPNMDHDFTELPDGTYASIVITPGESGGNADSIVEMSEDGSSTTTVWNAWEDPNLEWLQNKETMNWSHANGLDYDPTEDVYYISLKDIGTIVKVDRATGQGLWYINGRANEFTFTEGSSLVIMQHQFEKQPNGILVFDNGNAERGYSRAVEYELDEVNKTAHQVWENIHDPYLQVFAKGDVHRWEDGSTQIVWSSSGEIQDVEPDGTVTWQLNTELGYATTFVQPVESLYVWE